MNTFIGNIEAKSDEKGRIFVPAHYRRTLSEMGAKRLILRRDADNPCLICYPEQVWNHKVEQLSSQLDEWNAEDQMLLAQFVADAEYLEMDAQGRVLLQKRNLQSIGASNELVFVGMIDRFAIWDTATFQQRRLPQADFAKLLRDKMTNSQPK